MTSVTDFSAAGSMPLWALLVIAGCQNEPDVAPQIKRLDLFPGDRIERTTTLSLATLLDDPPGEPPADCDALDEALHSPERQPENQTDPFRADVTEGYLTATLTFGYTDDVDAAMFDREIESLETTLFLVTEPDRKAPVGLTCVTRFEPQQNAVVEDPVFRDPIVEGKETFAASIAWGAIGRIWVEGLDAGSYDVGVTLQTSTRTDTKLEYGEHETLDGLRQPLWTIVVEE